VCVCGHWFAPAAEMSSHAEQHGVDLCTVCKVRLRRSTSGHSGHSGAGLGDRQTMCSVCYLDQLCTRDGLQVIVVILLPPVIFSHLSQKAKVT